MGKKEREKGKRGEREWAIFCRREGFVDAARGQQFDGREAEDVIGLPDLHQEVKNVASVNIYSFLEQSIEECQGKIPMVAIKKTGKYFIVVMKAEDWFVLYKGYIKSKGGLPDEER